jgi:hypothetical protein
MTDTMSTPPVIRHGVTLISHGGQVYSTADERYWIERVPNYGNCEAPHPYRDETGQWRQCPGGRSHTYLGWGILDHDRATIIEIGPTFDSMARELARLLEQDLEQDKG